LVLILMSGISHIKDTKKKIERHKWN